MTKLKVVSATDLRTKTKEIMHGVKFKRWHCQVENFGEPMGVIISLEEYNKLLKGLSNTRAESEDEPGSQPDHVPLSSIELSPELK